MIDKRKGDEVMCIVPFDIANEKENVAFRVAIEKARNPERMQGARETQVDGRSRPARETSCYGAVGL